MRPKTTRGAKKAATPAATKKTGGGQADPIELGDADAEGEPEVDVVVKVEGAKKGKRKDREVEEEAPQPKKTRVDVDRGEGSSRGANRSDPIAKDMGVAAVRVGKKFFPERYFEEELTEEWATQTRLRAVQSRIDWLTAERAILTTEIDGLLDLRKYIREGLGEPSAVDEAA